MRSVPVKASGVPESVFAYCWSLMCRDNLLGQRACQIADVTSITPLFPWSELEESERVALRPVILELARDHLALELEITRRKAAARAKRQGAGNGAA